jgi:hypothetical protein
MDGHGACRTWGWKPVVGGEDRTQLGYSFEQFRYHWSENGFLLDISLASFISRGQGEDNNTGRDCSKAGLDVLETLKALRR